MLAGSSSNPASCDLNELVRDICERQREISSHADIRVDAPDLPIPVHCDSILIEQVVVNLLSNAVKYSGETPVVEVKVWVDGSRAYCSVRDWGIGIPADEVAKIFDRFYRARTASGIAGTGIGLNFAQKIMHLHGGEIQVESYEAGGSIVHVRPPRFQCRSGAAGGIKGACQHECPKDDSCASRMKTIFATTSRRNSTQPITTCFRPSDGNEALAMLANQRPGPRPVRHHHAGPRRV